MLGTHNSMSYLPIVNWWQRWQSRWCRCQVRSIKEQYANGVRFFDIRVRWIDEECHFVHNRIDFGKVNKSVFEFLNAQEDKVYIRFILDERKDPKNENYTHLYCLFIKDILSDYPNIIPYEILTYWDWKDHKKEIYDGNPSKCSIKNVEEMHASVCNNLIDYIIYGTKECRPKMNTNNAIGYYKAVMCKEKVLLVDNI